MKKKIVPGSRHFILVLCFTLATLSSSSQTLQWAFGIGGSGTDKGRTLATDAAGNVYVTGSYNGTVDFDPGAGIINLSSAGVNDVFIVKMDPSGNVVWAEALGGTGDDYGYSIAVDVSGNIYVTGSYNGTVDFDPGAGTFNLSSVGSFDAFVLKLDPAGAFVWASSIGGTLDEMSFSLVADASGNIYYTGGFSGTTDFDPGAGTFNLTSAGSSDIFISKLDNTGNLVWVKSIGSLSWNYGNMITLDASGNVFTTGNFNGTADFDPGAGTFNLTSNSGSSDVFVSKLSASGNFVWAAALGGSGGDAGYSLKTDGVGNAIVVGTFQGSADFDPSAGTSIMTSAGADDIFVCKLDLSGNLIWSKSIGSTGLDAANTVGVDATDNIFVGGYFTDLVDFDPNAGTYNMTSVPSGFQNIYITKISPSGSFLWARGIGGTSAENSTSLSIDPSNNIYFTGYFQGTADFNPNAGVLNISSAGAEDAFIAKFDQCNILVNAGADQTSCANNAPIALSGTSSTGFGIWTTSGTGTFSPDDISLGTVYIPSPADTAAGSVTIVLTSTNNASCTAVTDTLIHTITPAPTVIAGTDQAICGDIVAVALNGASSTGSGSWSSSGSGTFIPDNVTLNASYLPSVADSITGFVNLTLNSTGGGSCLAVMDTMNITFHLLPIASISPVSPIALCLGDTITLNGSATGGTGPYTYYWADAASFTSTLQNPQVSSPGSYTLTVTDISGCSNTATTSVVTTPNSDVYGHVTYSGGNVTVGNAVVFQHSPYFTSFDTIQMVSMDASGNYLFTGLPNGNYIVKIFPDSLTYPTLIPTYYGNTFLWDSAFVSPHYCADNDTLDIIMEEALAIGSGPGLIGGLIYEGVGFVRAEGDPIPGIDVKLGRNPGGALITSTHTNTSGYYVFPNLPLSGAGETYVVYVDIPGLERDSSYNIVLDIADPVYDSLNYLVDSSTIYILPTSGTGVGEAAADNNALNVYPNPTNGMVNIDYTLRRNSSMSLGIYNILGVRIKELLNNEQQAGNHKYSFNTRNYNLSAGVYFISLITDGKVSTHRLVITE